MYRLIRFLLCWFVLLTFRQVAQCADRVALVIGNSNYEGSGVLRNPGNDADAFEAVLEELGFLVIKKKDAELSQMEDALVAFRRALTKGGVGIFFYAGHGVQVKGQNFLVPIGAKLREEFEVKRQCLEVDQVLNAMNEAESNLKVLVLDCCRDNPFQRSWRRSINESGDGLAAISNIPDGTFVAFSTAPGKTAADGTGKNSPFTEQLVAAMRGRPAEGLELGEVFREASRAVKRVTGQVPWLSQEGSLDKYYLWRNGASESASNDDKKKADRAHDSTNEFRNSRIAAKSLADADALISGKYYDSGIKVFTRVVEMSEISKSDRDTALKGRAKAYIARMGAGDLEKALADVKAAGQTSIELVTKRDATLSIKDQATGIISITGNIPKSKKVLVTEIQENALRVYLAEGSKINGWTKLETFLEPLPSSNSRANAREITREVFKDNVETDLLRAERLRENRKFDDAIVLITQLIDTPTMSVSNKNNALSLRADIYIARMNKGDLNLALNDKKAVGKQLELFVKREADMEMHGKSRSKVYRSDKVLVLQIINNTLNNNEEVVVKSVNGNTDFLGRRIVSSAFKDSLGVTPPPAPKGADGENHQQSRSDSQEKEKPYQSIGEEYFRRQNVIPQNQGTQGFPGGNGFNQQQPKQPF